MKTLKEIAQAAGVSTATVSNVINGNHNRVSADTVERIQAIIQASGYVPNQAARSLAHRESHVIAVIVQAHEGENIFRNPYTAEYVGALTVELYRNGYYPLIRFTDDFQAVESDLRGWNVAGVGTGLGRGRGWGGDVAGTCGRGRRPRRPAPGAGRPAAPRRGRRGYGRDKRGPPAWHRAISLRNARVPAPRHEVPRDEISPRNNLEMPSRRAAGSTRAAFPGAASAARARREADAFPVLAHRVPVVICITFPCEARAAGDTALPLENRDKIRRKVNVLFLLNRLLE